MISPPQKITLFTLCLTLWVDDGCAFRPSFGAKRPFQFIRRATPPATADLSTSSTIRDGQPAQRGAISMGLEELAGHLGGFGRAQLVWDLYSIGVDPALFFDPQHSSEELSSSRDDILQRLPSMRRKQSLGKDALDRLASLYPHHGRLEGGVASLSHISQSRDTTTKLLLRLHDGLEVETVIIPWKGERSTLCISSQVGCRQGCTFCATGRMGRLRSLSSDEIIAQLFFAKKICRIQGLPEIRNIVFMGMGEPADNAESVVNAAEILTTNELFQLSATKVTISTVAPTPDAFRQLGKAPCVLAWSVHAANNDLRKRLIPTTRYSMEDLRQGLIDALLERPENNLRTLMVEVALMDGVNDSLEQADELADFAKVLEAQVPGCKLVVNLIPFNDIGQDLYRKPSPERVQAFQQRLWESGLYTHIRATRGDDESAACGQLATKKKRQREQASAAV